MTKTYVYKISSDLIPVTYVDTVQKVYAMVEDHCKKTNRTPIWTAGGNYRTAACQDEEGNTLEMTKEDKLVGHCFLVEQIEVL